MLLLTALTCTQSPATHAPTRKDPPQRRERTLVAMLHGGGPEADDLFGRFVEESGAGHVVTLGSNDLDDPYLYFFDDYFVSLGAQSAATINTNSADDAFIPGIADEIDLASAIFLRGGDQAAYLEQWVDSPIHEALIRARDRGVPIAGTSAGCAVLGERIYDARVSSIDAWEALDDPADPGLTFASDFLDLVPGVITDTHFTERGRLGRLAVFVGLWQETGRDDIVGVGVDPETSLYVYDDGTAEVQGTGFVTVLHPATTLSLVPGQPASLGGMRLWQLPSGYTLDLHAPNVVLERPSWVLPTETTAAEPSWPDAIIDGNNLSARSLGDFTLPEIDEPDYPWYYGRLTEQPADRTLPGTFVLTRLYDDSDRFEAHIGGTLWTLARHIGTISIGVDIGHRAFVTAPDIIGVTDGWALVLDTRTATHSGDPQSIPQTVALEGAVLDVVSPLTPWSAN